MKNLAEVDSQSALFKSRMKMEKENLVRLVIKKDDEIKLLREELERLKKALSDAEASEESLDERNKTLGEQVSVLDKRLREQ